jgi:anthrone oxygenase-like protein
MITEVLATLCSGLFAGAAAYVTVAEAPALQSCGMELAAKAFPPTYRRAAAMQAPLALVGFVSGLAASWSTRQLATLAATLLLGSVLPYTGLVVMRVNNRLLAHDLDARSPEVGPLLSRWARLHSVRTLLGTLAFLLFTIQLAAR